MRKDSNGFLLLGRHKFREGFGIFWGFLTLLTLWKSRGSSPQSSQREDKGCNVTSSNLVLTTKKLKNMEKIVSIKILRPITLPIIGMFLITYIIVAYVFDLDM